jgi:hypothetical protein
VHADVLLAIDGVAVLHGRKEAPAVQRFQQDLVEPRILRGLDEFDVNASVGVDFEVRDGGELETLFSQIVGQHGDRL